MVHICGEDLCMDMKNFNILIYIDMKKTKISCILASALLAFSAQTAGAQAASAAKAPATVAHTALFDYFSYSGDDDIYKKVKLEGEGGFYNPILPGWYSDPSICRVGDDYFMVTSSFSYYPGVPLFHSKDLVNWKQISYILDRPSQLPLAGQKVSAGIFAPAISYNPHNKTFYMITTNVGWGNFFVKTKDPFGSWSEPIRLPDVKGIDPSFFFDDDGKAYIVNNDEPEGKAEYDGHRAIRVREFDVNTDKTVGPEKILVNKGVHPEDKPIWIEGPHMYKINGKYFLMSAEGGTSDMHSEVIFRSDSPFGPFVPAKKNPILTQRDLDPNRIDPVTCAGHADLVQTPSGDWWAVFLACRPCEGKFENLGRETFLLPVSWTDEGFPLILEQGKTVPMTGNVKGAVRGKNVTFGNFAYNDDFSEKTLPLDWFSLRGPVDSICSTNAVPGYLSMKCVETTTAEKAVPAYVGRRIQHHKFECSSRLVFEPQTVNERAGMLLFKDETHQYLLCVAKTSAGKAVELRKTADGGKDEILASSALAKADKDIRLKIVSRGLTFDFYYAVGKGEWKLLKNNVDAGFLSTRNAGGFTGTTIGLYATRG